MKIFLDESYCREQLFPFTLTRHVADMRIGILSIREKWEKLTGGTVSTSITDKSPNDLTIKANIIPTLGNFKAILADAEKLQVTHESETIRFIHYPWHLFQYNDFAVRQDFELLTNNRQSQPISGTNRCIQSENIFIEEGAIVEHSILNASSGPIYVGRNATIMEGNMIRGPFAMGEGSTLKMGSKVYGATTLGLFCVAGGEIKNSIFFGNSNKAHDGYLGDSVIGEWCNLGAGTSNSNVKNTASDVKYQLDKNMEPIISGNKGGLLMGDYSRAAINTSFNTGTVVGVCCNIFGNYSPGKYIANFSWGDERYDFEKAIKDISNWKKMKGQLITEEETQQLALLYKSNK